jgi:spore coat protein CotH
MIRTYQQTGEKDSFHANLTIDGVTIPDVGVRLKGHASLMTQVCVERPGGQRSEPAQPTEGQATRPTRPELPQGAAIPSGCKLPGVLDNARAPDEIEQLPLLIRFDENVSGQTYQGYTAIAIRTGGVSDDAAMLQEPVTNSIYRLMGQPAPLTAYTGMRFNDGQETLYVVAEVIDEAYLVRNLLVRHFGETRGVLYKASLGAEVLTYKGADPSDYSTSFSQETRLGEADLAPLIEFIRFINESDETAFASDLPRHLDINSFTTYLAINTLLVNMDSLVSGNGNNFYLYYDESEQRMTLLFWDGNESLGAFSPERAVSMPISIDASNGVLQSILISRFLAQPAFRALYEAKLQLVYEQVFSSGAIMAQTEEYIDLVSLSSLERNLVDMSAYEAAANKVRPFLSQRANFLSKLELFGSGK